MQIRPIVSIALLTLFALGLLPAVAGAHNFPVHGEGKDTYGLEFSFRAKGSPTSASGQVFFETNSFGDFDGTVDCLYTVGPLAALSGSLDNPNTTSGLTHFMFVVEDKGATKPHKRPKDEIVTWLRNGPFDCKTELAGSLADARKRIKKGEITVD